jgi:hypothetical protein
MRDIREQEPHVVTRARDSGGTLVAEQHTGACEREHYDCDRERAEGD